MTSLIVSTFPNAKALPLLIARELGFFARHKLDVAIDKTESSAAQRKALAAGDIHIVQAAVDNALAMIAGGVDAIIVMGGESGMNEFIVQSDIHSFAEFKGRTLVVDSPDTAYALQGRKLLAGAGLEGGRDYPIRPLGNSGLRFQALIDDPQLGGGVLNPPFSSEAKLRGLRSLGRLVDLLGPYQAGGAFALRAWAKANAERLESYIAAYVEALRWLADPANKAAAVAMLAQELALSASVADASYLDLVDPVSGFTRDAKLNMVGFSNMLETRFATEGVNETLADFGAYIDESYYQRALARLAA